MFFFLYVLHFCLFFFFFFNDTATTEIYTLSLHDALPISTPPPRSRRSRLPPTRRRAGRPDRKSTRLNSSHDQISYAVFCLKKKKTQQGPSPADSTKHGVRRRIAPKSTQ